MKLYRNLDKNQRLSIPKELIRQLNILPDKDGNTSVELDIAEINNEKVITVKQANIY